MYDVSTDEAFREALRALVGREPPEWVRYDRLDDDQHERIIDWIGEGSEKMTLAWSTLTALIMAAELLVEMAAENANIRPEVRS